MTVFILVSDLQVFDPNIDTAKAAQMILDAHAIAVLIAPCIEAVGFANTNAVKAIMRAAILRWNEAGTGAMTAETAGPFSVTMDTRTERKGMFWPSEIRQLEGLCSTGGSFTLSLAGR